jgi:hypothetical protein
LDTPENLIGTPMDFAHPEDIEGILTDFNNLLVNYLPIRIEYKIPRNLYLARN